MGPLITASSLAGRIGAADVAVCDVRWYLADPGRGREEYDLAHIPGALFVDLHSELAGGAGGGRHPLPDVGDFAELLGRRGIGPATAVVAYDDAGGAVAARLWWMLRSIGHGAVAVLDGGFSAWIAGGHPVSSAVPSPIPTTYPRPAGWSGIVGADDVAAAASTQRVVIDARAPDRYRGEHEPIDPRAGHVPGAINVPHSGNLAADGTHLPPRALAERFAATGDGAIVYCGSGVTACHDLLAMDVAGIAGGRLYPGSWSEWSSDPERPIATG